MRLKTHLIKSMLCTVLMFNIMLTASGQQVDSIKFSLSETKTLIKAWENYETLKTYADSSDKQLSIIMSQRTNDSILLYAANDLIKSKEAVILANQNLVNSGKVELKRERMLRKVWKSLAGGFGFIALIEGSYIWFTSPF